MKYKYLSLDLDGTLTNSQKIITPKTKNALIKAQENGITIILASGRPTKGILQIAEELRLKEFGGYILSYNGAKIINCKTNEVIYEKFVPDEIKETVYDISKKYGINILTYENDAIITENSDRFIEIESKINHMPVKIVKSFIEALKFPVVKYLMTGEPELLEKIEPLVYKKLLGYGNVFRSEPFFLEVVPENLDKAASMNIFLQSQGSDRTELIACGDGFNDKSMIEFAGLGVAMENAQKPVKDVADYITLSNDSDGIAKVVDKFIFSEIGIFQRSGQY